MCYGDGDMDKPVALIQANVVELKKWAQQTGTDYGGDVEKLCKLPAAEKLVLDSCVAAGKSGGLGANEILKAVALISGEGSPQDGEPNSPWTPDNGGLTASNKLNRQPIM